MKFSILESFGIWDAGKDASQYLHRQVSLSTPNTIKLKGRAADGGYETGEEVRFREGEWEWCQGRGDTCLLYDCPIGASSVSVRLSKHLNPQT